MENNQKIINWGLYIIFCLLLLKILQLENMINGNDTGMKYITCTNTIYLENEPISNFSKEDNSIDVTLKDGTKFIADSNECVISSDKLEQGGE